jgi:hypothetical protein
MQKRIQVNCVEVLSIGMFRGGYKHLDKFKDLSLWSLASSNHNISIQRAEILETRFYHQHCRSFNHSTYSAVPIRLASIAVIFQGPDSSASPQHQHFTDHCLQRARYHPSRCDNTCAASQLYNDISGSCEASIMLLRRSVLITTHALGSTKTSRSYQEICPCTPRRGSTINAPFSFLNAASPWKINGSQSQLSGL